MSPFAGLAGFNGGATGLMLRKKGSSLLNYYGDGSNGALTTAADVIYTVESKNGSYDGDMMVKQYTSVNIASGTTVTVDQPCRGFLIYCQGDMTINGTLSMTARGAAANPTISGGSDNNTVSSSGLQYGFVNPGGTDTLTMTQSLFNGCGNSARNVIANAPSGTGSDYTVHTIPRTANNGANRPSVSSNGTRENPADIRGGNGSTGGAKLGGGGAGGQAYETYNGQGGAGGHSTCFSGGSGGGGAAGGGAANSGHRGSDAQNYGGQGGTGGNHNENSSRPKGTGGAGNPGGPDGTVGTQGNNDAGDGTGGLIMIIVGGNLTIGSGGKIEAKGTRGGDSSATSDNSSMGGGSGGGHVMILCAGDVIANGNTIATGDYVGNAGSPIGSAGTYGEQDYNIVTWGGRGGKNTSGDTPVQNMYTGTTLTRQGGTGGKGLISIYSGVS